MCYRLLKDYGENNDVFEFVCKYYQGPPENGSISIEQFFSEDEIDEYESVYGDTVNGLLRGCIKKCNFGIIEPQKFYEALWTDICVVFQTLKERAFAFYYVIIDATIPYQYLGKPLSMSNERFKELVDKNKDSIEKVRYIARSKYTQRTERASLLLNCLDEIDDFESRTVVLAQAILILSQGRLSRASEVDSLLQELDKRIQLLEQHTSDQSGEHDSE